MFSYRHTFNVSTASAAARPMNPMEMSNVGMLDMKRVAFGGLVPLGYLYNRRHTAIMIPSTSEIMASVRKVRVVELVANLSDVSSPV